MRIIYFDTETTGTNPKKDNIIELALYIVENGRVVEKYDKFIKQDKVLPSVIVELTGITDELLRLEGVDEQSVAKDLYKKLKKGTLMVAHNTQFDLNFIYNMLCSYYDNNHIMDLFSNLYWLDTLTIFKDRKSYPHKLKDLVEYYNLGDVRFHRAIDDTSVLPVALIEMTRERNDIKEYVNVFGYNPRYGVTGKRFGFIKYYKQDYHDSMVKSEDILPYQKNR